MDSLQAYHLHIDLEGKHYQSDALHLPKPLQLEHISCNPTRFDTITPNLDGLYLTLKATTNEDGTATKFYRYDIGQTYMIETIKWGESYYIAHPIFYNRYMHMIRGYFSCPSDPRCSRYLFDVATPEMIKAGKVTPEMIENNQDIFHCAHGHIYDGQVVLEKVNLIRVEFERTTNTAPRFCWAYEYQANAAEISIENRTTPSIHDFPVYYLKIRYNFGIRYSALIKQFALDSDYYKYMELSKKFSIGEQSLYHIQPGYVEGNIHSVSDAHEKVIGYFYATAI